MKLKSHSISNKLYYHHANYLVRALIEYFYFA